MTKQPQAGLRIFMQQQDAASGAANCSSVGSAGSAREMLAGSLSGSGVLRDPALSMRGLGASRPLNIARRFENCCMLQSDICGFTQLGARVSPLALCEMLHGARFLSEGLGKCTPKMTHLASCILRSFVLSLFITTYSPCAFCLCPPPPQTCSPSLTPSRRGWGSPRSRLCVRKSWAGLVGKGKCWPTVA